MAYNLSDGKPAYFYSLLSYPLRAECPYLLLSLFTLKLIIDESITNGFDGFRGYYIALAMGTNQHDDSEDAHHQMIFLV